MRPGILCSLCVLVVLNVPAATAQIHVELPIVSVEPGDFVRLPITVSEADERAILAYEFVLHYDPDILDLEGAEIAGTMSEDGMQIANTRIPGEFKFAFASATPLDGEGLLIVLTGHALQEGASPLHFESFWFNEGTPEALAIDGWLSIGSEAAKPDSARVRSVQIDSAGGSDEGRHRTASPPDSTTSPPGL